MHISPEFTRPLVEPGKSVSPTDPYIPLDILHDGSGLPGNDGFRIVRDIVVPDEFLGDVIGQLNARRGEILGMEIRPGQAQAVRAMVPLAEMFGYATELRSATKGRGVFTMEFDHYAQVSDNVARQITTGM